MKGKQQKSWSVAVAFYCCLLGTVSRAVLFESAPKKLIIDTDAGIDDAVALMQCAAAHRANDTEVLAITAVSGNTNVTNVAKNVLKILKTVDALEIQVYRGAPKSLVYTPPGDNFFGDDGFGDIEIEDPPDYGSIQQEHAVSALLKLVDKYPGEITLLCIGPLTNIALAMKMDPEFTSKLKALYVMGGNTEGVGNIKGAEFNFYQDAEAAHVVLNESTRIISLLPWESNYLRNHISQEWRDNVLGKVPSPAVDLLNRAEAAIQSDGESWVTSDGMLGAIVLQPDLVTNSLEVHVGVELCGTLSRGATIVDYMHITYNTSNVCVIKDIDVDKFKDTLIKGLGY